MKNMKNTIPVLLCLAAMTIAPVSQDDALAGVRLVSISKGWSQNSVNAVIFRRNSVVTHKDSQYVAFYDKDANVVLAKRRLRTETWTVRKTQYKGNVRDAHNSISIMIDGDGFLHMAWDHHNRPLRYCRSKTPESLELTDKTPMTEKKESKVTYPEFYRLSDGNLLFVYRDGRSGRGNMMMNHYDLKTRKWTQRQDAFIDGEGKRNAYWQMCTDTRGAIHISWVWRESGDVATNHDMCYAKSTDGGVTWRKSDGRKYKLPITVKNAEYARRIPQRSELMNQTSMCADSKGRPYIATYWRPEGTKIPQYHVIYHDGTQWRTQQITKRKTPFRLSGGGSKRVPISPPQIVADCSGSSDKAYMVFRDRERSDRVSVAVCDNLRTREWRIKDLTKDPVYMWEPSYDTELWKRSKILHIYAQRVGQGDGEKLESIPPQMISILEWKPE
ncbi:MAG: BNR repeat-containing protein [Phycisphaerae bacterium]|jgi:hypothetical protein|nr:BNR repeat-containing protein [Phycisphaerae bacterium]